MCMSKVDVRLVFIVTIFLHSFSFFSRFLRHRPFRISFVIDRNARTAHIQTHVWYTLEPNDSRRKINDVLNNVSTRFAFISFFIRIARSFSSKPKEMKETKLWCRWLNYNRKHIHVIVHSWHWNSSLFKLRTDANVNENENERKGKKKV